MPKRIALFTLYFAIACYAQEDSASLAMETNYCASQAIPISCRIQAQLKTVDLEHRRQQFKILWNHHPNSVDTFFITNEKDHIVYISSPTLRFLNEPNQGVHRALAQHHLRERIRYSPLRLDDLELLARGLFQCPDTLDRKIQRLRTAFSNTWYSLLQQATTITMYGLKGMERKLLVHEWWVDPAFPPVPSNLEITESNGQYATLKILSVEKLDAAPIPMSLPKSPYEQMLRHIPFGNFLWPPKEPRSDGEVMLPPFK